MSDSYGLDLQTFCLDRFRRTLETGDVLPSRQILREDIAGRFSILESLGIRTLKDLIDALSTSRKVEEFARRSGLPLDYLKMLRRQARSYLPTPVKFDAIPGLDPLCVDQLAAAGIKHTRHLFEQARTRAARADLGQRCGVPGDVLLELVCLTDLARAGWVGPVFVRMIYETGVHTLADLADSTPDDLFERLRAVNADQQFTKASFTLKDVAATIATAQELPQVIEY
jgi:hypothetical protein